MEQASSWRRNSYMTKTNNHKHNFHNSQSKYLLALHSCSETFGIAIENISNPDMARKVKTFSLGRSLSNKLFTCVEAVLPKQYWKQIIRIAVATGPGGFTTTRLTLSMARILSQQIGCSLDSISTFHLMASRLHKTLKNINKYESFWIKNLLPRRGIVAGKYKLDHLKSKYNYENFLEITPPQLFKVNHYFTPSINALDNVDEDINQLLNLCHFMYLSAIENRWEKVLPIYPTSPVK